MRVFTDNSGSYDLDQVVAIVPGSPLARGRTEVSARLHLSSGAVLGTQTEYGKAVAAWQGLKAQAEKGS